MVTCPVLLVERDLAKMMVNIRINIYSCLLEEIRRAVVLNVFP